MIKQINERCEKWWPMHVEHSTDPASSAAPRHMTLSDVSGKFSGRWICEYDFSGELDPEPLFELHDEENRCGRIHPKTSELRMRAHAIGRRLKGLGQIRHAPIEYFGFAGI